MPKDLGIVTIHGMGDTSRNYADKLKRELKNRLPLNQWRRIHVESIYYQDVLQKNQNDVFKRMLNKELEWVKLRKFILFGFSDSAAFEQKAHLQGSVYEQIQQKVLHGLDNAFNALQISTKPVLIVAHSLGCHVISNYIYDSQKTKPRIGVWRDGQRHGEAAGSARDRFRHLRSLRGMFTTGCNIPIFVAALPRNRITPFKKPNVDFKWLNYYDDDDALGWPLEPLSQPYRALVKDIKVNAGGGFFGHVFLSWNPHSHSAYWTDGKFIDSLTRHVKAMLA